MTTLSSMQLHAAYGVSEQVANDFAQPLTEAHLFAGMLHDEDSKIAQLMREHYRIGYADARAAIASMYGLPLVSGRPSFDDRLTKEAKSALNLMDERLADSHDGNAIEPTEQLFTAVIIQAGPYITRLLAMLDIDRDELLAQIDPTAVPVD